MPVFALLSAGVTIGGLSGLASALTDPVAIGIIAGLVVGKPIGITGATWLVARFTRAPTRRRASPGSTSSAWPMLAGIGFTVSLLIGELAFGLGSDRDDHVKVAVLTGSLAAALLAAIVLRLRNRAYRRIHDAENVDADHDGIPDVYQQDTATRPESA